MGRNGPPVWCICTDGGSCRWNLPKCSVRLQHCVCSSKYGTSPVGWNPDIGVCGNCLAIIFIHVLMISEHNHECSPTWACIHSLSLQPKVYCCFFCVSVRTYLTFFHWKSERTFTRHWWSNMYFIFIISESQFFSLFLVLYIFNEYLKKK